MNLVLSPVYSSELHLVFCMLSHLIVSDSLQPHGLQPTRLFCPWDFPGKNTGVGSHSLLQGIFPSQGLCLLHWQADSLPLHHLGSQVWTNSHECEVEGTSLGPGLREQQGGSSQAGGSKEARPTQISRSCPDRRVYVCIPGNQTKGRLRSREQTLRESLRAQGH